MIAFVLIMLLIAGIAFGAIFYFFRWLKKQNPTKGAVEPSDELPTVQSYFGIKGIDRGIMILQGGRYRVFIEGNSLNIPLMSEEEQMALESRFASLLARINFPIQIYNQNRPLDMEEVMASLSDQYDHAPDNLREYAEYLKEYLANLTEVQPIWVRRKLIVITLDDPDANMDEVIKVLDGRARLILSELEACGIQARCLNTEEIAQVWYTFLNKDRVLTQPFRNIVEAGHTTSHVGGDLLIETA
ncbi:hypothetical protein DNHGIG_40040 [Collibacillus ludicampi]|uniref:Uncharacterized protein n=1 Tax=Collibacillus ludicampi TaxID=2771369 RepID=A0AAV4LKN3_9BACL|nr:TraC family protein [Collibacillus ludicampi]GIM48455.1 hypothetical protein DNHGIG_40040 [Collibacillus ludicampi]